MIFQECGVLTGNLYFIQRIAFDHGHIFEFYLKFMMWPDLHQNLDEVVYLVILGLCLTQICWWFKISLVDYSLICNPKINFINELLSKFDVDFALFWCYFFKNSEANSFIKKGFIIFQFTTFISQFSQFVRRENIVRKITKKVKTVVNLRLSIIINLMVHLSHLLQDLLLWSIFMIMSFSYHWLNVLLFF